MHTLTNYDLAQEREFHDRQAAGRARTFADDPARLRFADADYLDHETWVRPAVAALGPLAGRSVLDYGCGHGMAAVVFARAGADVSGFDLSDEYVAEARQRAAANGVRAHFTQADAHRLPFADHAFDAVWGCAVLHHLDLPVAGREVARVLRPGGVAVFCEPWGGNPLLEFARESLPYPGKHRTPGERPLTRRGVRLLRPAFASVEVRGHQLLGMLSRALRRPTLARALARADAGLLAAVPALENWCRYVVLVCRRG